MSTGPTFTVEYLDPPAAVEAEDLPDEFSVSRLRRSLMVIVAIVLVVVARPGALARARVAARPVRPALRPNGSSSPASSRSARAPPTS